MKLRPILCLLAAACACTPIPPPPACGPRATEGPGPAATATSNGVVPGVTRVPWTIGSLSLPDKKTVVVRPREIQDLLINPGMGFQTFQRYHGQALYPGMFGRTWSEAGPEKAEADAGPLLPRFPASSVAYCRWHWSTLEPEKGQIRWDILDLALSEAKRHGQTLALRIMPYDPDYPLPAWYRESGARRANKDSDPDGKLWHPDHADPLYAKHWGELVKKVGERYDGRPEIDSVDISSIGPWGEGSATPMPPVSVEEQLVDLYFEVFQKTPLLVNDQPRVIERAVRRGAGWRVDCWGDMRSADGGNWGHMLDSYPALTARPAVRDAWQKAPVSLEVCGVVED